ncbi:SRPBCC family protein [Conyzicola sp.]|uniref:SRPBCC family protein n=1 Tax=Conyzicola sp. TaxID=1969404 RepID=UPI00398A0A98
MTALPGGERRFDWRRSGIGAVTILALVVILALWQRAHPYSIETSVDIDATPQHVWTTLTDFDAYSEWNPTLTGMRGEVEEDERLAFENDGTEFTPTVLEVDENRLLRWEGHVGVVGIFDGEHSFTLEALPGGGTRFTQSEQFRGVAVLFFTETLRSETAPSFHAMNAALRDRVEGDRVEGENEGATRG